MCSGAPGRERVEVNERLAERKEVVGTLLLRDTLSSNPDH